MRLRSIVGQPGNSSIISRVKLRQTTVQLGKSAEFDDVGHRLGLTTGAQISVCKAPCLSTGTAMPLTGTETVQERPLLSWEGETRLAELMAMLCEVYMTYETSCSKYCGMSGYQRAAI